MRSTSRWAGSLLAVLLTLASLPAFAQPPDSPVPAASLATLAPEPASTSGWTMAIASPIGKITLSKKPQFQPSFTPGPGIGYAWMKGHVGFFLFPGFAIPDGDDFVIVPHLVFHAYFFEVGMGYQWKFRKNNAGDLALYSDAPVITLGAGVTLKAIESLTEGP